MTTRVQRLAPLTGVLAVVLIVVALGVGGDSPDSDASARKVVSYFSDHDDREMFAGVLEGAAAVALVFFVAILAVALRRSGERTVRMAVAAFGGGIVAAGGFATDGAIRFALADSAEDIEPAAAQALNALWGGFFIPFIAGLATLLLATAIGSYKTRLLPIWLVWLTVVIVIVMFTPVGFIGGIAAAVWIIIVSVLLTLRETPADRASVDGQPAPNDLLAR